MGEGEGAQAYGWGTYVTEVEGIAKYYAEKTSHLTTTEYENRIINKLAAETLKAYNDNAQDAINYLESLLKDPTSDKKRVNGMIKVLETGKNLPEGNIYMYTVDIPENNGTNYLDWANDIDDTQRNDILNALSDIDDPDFDIDYLLDKLDQYEDMYNLTGEAIYKLINKYGFGGDAKKTSDFFSSLGYVGISYPAQYTTGGRKDNASNYVIFNEQDAKITNRLQFLQTPNGDIYGFVKDGEIYLNDNLLNTEAPIHEYTHLWDTALQSINPTLWATGVKLMQQTPVWGEIKNNPAYADIADNDDLLASEVHARLVGKQGAAIFDKMVAEAKKTGNTDVVSVISKLRDWVNNVWDWVKSIFGNPTNITTADFVNMPIKDLVNATRLRLPESLSDKNRIQNNLTNNNEDDFRDEFIRFRIREDAPPQKTGIGYKVFVLKNGKLYPPMVANPNGADTPIGVWLDADAAPITGQSKTGRNQVKAGGKGTQGGSGKLAFRPGWHLGEIPYALQFNRIDETGVKSLFPRNFVWAEVEYANDVDYQDEARSYGINANGKYQHSLAGLPRIPVNGSYKYRTNPNPETDPWIITGAIKINRLLTPSEVDEMVKNAGREPQQRQSGSITDDEVMQINKENMLSLDDDADIRFRMDNDLEAVNKRFNEELERYQQGKMSKNEMFHLGLPNGVMSIFLPNLPIVMRQRVVNKGANKKHNVEVSSIINMPQKISEPIFVFKKNDKSLSILSEMKDKIGRNVFVAFDLSSEIQDGGRYIEVNDVTTVHGRRIENIIRPINENNSLQWVDKKKALEWFSSASPNVQQEITSQELKTASNIIKNFENPNPETEKNTEDIRFRLDTPEEQQVSMASEASDRTYTETDKAPEIDYDMPATDVIEQISAKSSVEPLFRQGTFDKDFAAIVALQDAIKQTSLYQQNASSKELANRLNVGLYDAMAPLKDFISQIEESRGQKIDDDHNPYYLENASASKAQERIESLKRDNIEPLAETTNDAAQLLQGREMLKLYLMGKTGLERQDVKEASQQDEGFYDYAGLTGLQRMLIIQQIGEANITDDVISTLNSLDYPQLLDYANDHNYMTVDKYVADCDKTLGDTGTDLWVKIRELSKKQLRGQYDAGLISSDAYYYLTTGIRISDVLAENKNKGIISDKTYNNIADADMDVSELRDKGYITQQQYDMLTTYKPLYMYYLPLKGDASITASDINDYESREQKNKSKISKVKGHENLVRDPLTQLVSDCYGAIQNEEHNRWLREVLRAARLSNLSDNVVKITPLNVGATRVATEGEAAAKQGKKRNERLVADVKATNKQVDEHSVIVFDGGRAYKMTFADLSLAKALRTSGGRFADASAFVNWASRATRMWAMTLTTLNPMFVASNTFRDVGEALFVNYVNLGAKSIPVFIRAWNPANELQKAVHRHLKGKPGNTPYDALVKEYFDNGGPTSFSMLPDFDKIKSDMDKMVRDSKRGNYNPVKMTKTVLDWLEVQAKHSELLSRVATYAMYRGTLPEYNIGKNASITEAIWQSKEVTVNFDKRGAWAKELGVTSLFWNAGRQSNRIHYNLLKNHPVRYLAATAAMSSIKVALPGLLSTLMSYLYGDDKGKEYLDKYYMINRYTRYNNICLLWGDAIVKIPISPSFGPTAIMSEIVSEMIYTDFDKDRALSMTADLAQSMATLVGNDVFGSVVGTIAKGEPKELIGAIPFAVAKPFAELLANRNWQGRQIMRDYQGLDYLPAYYKAYGNVEDYYIESAKWINKITGGDEGKPGKLNKLIGNPAANKHIIESYLGGLGSFIFDALNTGANIVNGRWDRVIAESPMKRFLGDPEVYQDQEAWEDYYAVKSKINEYSARINSYKQAGNERKAYKLEDVRDELKYLLKPYDDYIATSKEDMDDALKRKPKDAREIRRKYRRDMAKYLKTLKKQIEHIDFDL